MKLTLARAHGRTLLSLLLVAAAACGDGDDPAPTPPPRALSRVDVSPASPWLVAGSAMSFYATAVYSDQTSADVTEQATWSSGTEAVLSVSTAPGTRGAAQALEPGTSVVTATYEGVAGSTNATVLAAGAGTTIAGTVTYDFVPARYDPATDSGGLDFAASSRKPVRGALVRVMQGTTRLGETTTDREGRYAITFMGSGEVSVIALAKTLSPPVQVEDNTNGDTIWAIGTSLAAANATVNLHATHGWNGTSYAPAARSAAPFAILDSMYTAAEGFLAVRFPSFPALKVNWSPGNAPNDQSIGTSHYSPADGEIYVLGLAGDDTDEFDKQVIVHEWAHYFEDRLSRSESPGGPHTSGDVLDPRLAFSEGGATALAAILLRDAIYADTGWWFGQGGTQLGAVGFDAENVPSPTDDFGASGLNPGPFSEMSITRAVYDLWDTGTNETWDGISVDLGVVYDVLVGPQKATPALATIAPFVTGLKATAGVNAAAVDTVLAHYSIGPISDDWGTGDTDLRGMYRDVSVPSSGHSFTLDSRFDPNMQQQNRYLVFTGNGSTVTVTSTSAYDVDLDAYHRGALVGSDASSDGNERIQFATLPGERYVVILSGWATTANVNGPYSATVNISTP